MTLTAYRPKSGADGKWRARVARMDINDLVSRLMYSGAKTRIDPDGLAELGFEYRAKKTPEDFRLAWQRGLAAGCGKVECEEMEVGNRLARVVKKAKK